MVAVSELVGSAGEPSEVNEDLKAGGLLNECPDW
jgi:hypothetical protein